MMSDSENLTHVVEPLRKLALPIESLNLDPNNARMHDKRNLDAIKASLVTFGQREHRSESG